MPPGKIEFWSSIVEPRLEAVANIADKIAVAAVVCRRGVTPPISNFQGHTIESRFYSDTEVEDFLFSLRAVGIAVSPFYREDDFIDWISTNPPELSSKRLFVYSSGASAPGIGAKSLVPAFCTLHQIAVMGPDPHVASLGRHKFHVMALLRSSGIPVPATYSFAPGAGWLDQLRPIPGSRLIIKPSHEAASIGVDSHSVIECDDDIDDFVAGRAERFGQSMTVQEFVRGHEVEVPAFLFEQIWYTPVAVGLSIGGIRPLDSRFLDYEMVATDRYEFYEYVASNQAAQEKLFVHVRRAASLLGLRDFGRVDFRIDDKGNAFVIDVSTSPYLSRHSSFSFAASLCKGDPSQLPLALLAASCHRLKLIP
jgi:D-alanine-D-alanine ligase